MKTQLSTFICLALFCFGYAQCDPMAVFAETSVNSVCTEVISNVRYFYSNNIPDHGQGTLNGGFTTSAQEDTWTMCAAPTQGTGFTQLYGNDELNGCSNQLSYKFGVGTNGVSYAPSARDYFEKLDQNSGIPTGEFNYDWNIEAVFALGVNNQGAHLNAKGEYHYHAAPQVYFTGTTGAGLGIDGSAFSPIVGYAADGFPVYYKYAYADPNDINSGIVAFDSNWQLKSGNRPGDGFDSPDGAYTGLYVEDYEFNASASGLDECNGRFGVTPDFPGGTYYYVLTDSWPYIPRCFKGSHVDESFLIGSSCPSSSASASCSQILDVSNSLNLETLNFYPNPVTSKLNFEIPSGFTYTIGIYDANGKKISHYENMKSLDVQHLSNGVYFINIYSRDINIVKKIIVEK